MDMSKALLKIAKNHKGVDGVRANCLKIPFKDESFDAIICIAVLHHLSTKVRIYPQHPLTCLLILIPLAGYPFRNGDSRPWEKSTVF